MSRRDLTGSKRWHFSVYELQAMRKAQAEKSGPLFRVYDEIGRPTDFIGTLEQCNDQFGDRDVTYVPQSKED